MRAPLKRMVAAVAGALGVAPRPLPEKKTLRIPLPLLALRTDLWVGLLREAMARSGRGYRKPCMKRRPPEGASRWRGERRPDKVEEIAREAKMPIERGKINFRRSDPRWGMA